MDKSSFKLVGAACGQHGQYTFYKALRVTTGRRDRVLAIGDFFFVRIWPDSELVSIGELQLLWTDRVADQTLVSLRLYFLPENTPMGRNGHGEDEVLALNEKVVLKAEDLLSWMCSGAGWRCGLRAVWRGACVPPAPNPAPAPTPTEPLHHTALDFADVIREKGTSEEDTESPGVVVFSYPRYCRYRALMARLEGMQDTWLRHSLVAALGGYAADTTNTTILYCKDTFEYPELEGHEFVCSHLAPRLKGRPRGRRRRAPRSDRSPPSPRSPDSRSSDSDGAPAFATHARALTTHAQLAHKTQVSPRRLSLRNGAGAGAGAGLGAAERGERASEEEEEVKPCAEDRLFLAQLRHFYKEKGEDLGITHPIKHLSLRAVFEAVWSKGGYEAVTRNKMWRSVHPDRPARVRSLYERFLLPYEAHVRRARTNGSLSEPPRPPSDPPATPTTPAQDHHTGHIAGTINCKEEVKNEDGTRTAEELNREFLESLPPKEEKPFISVKPPQLLIDPDKQRQSVVKLLEAHSGLVAELAAQCAVSGGLGRLLEEVSARGAAALSDGSKRLLRELADRLPADNSGPTALLKELARSQDGGSASASALSSLSALGDRYTLNGHAAHTNGGDQKSNRPAPTATGRSSLRAVRVKPARAPHSHSHSHTHHSHSNTNTPPTPVRGDSASSSPPALAPAPGAPPLTNFGINRTPPHPSATATAPAPAGTGANAAHSDDEIVEVPYKPKTPEIIDLDEYPESPQSAKRKKLDILKERGLEVTALPPTPSWAAPPASPAQPPAAAPHAPHLLLNPAVQHQIMTQASLFQMYNIIPQHYTNGIQPPRVIQSSCLYGNLGPEKTVYGNPKDPFMAPPHILQGAPIKPLKAVAEKVETIPKDILDLTCKTSAHKPTVEIVRLPPAPAPAPSPSKMSAAQNLSKNYTLLDGKAVVGSNLEITLVSPKSQTPPKTKQPQKRSSTGKFMSTKTPTPPKEHPKDYPKSYVSPGGAKLSPTVKKNPINIPTYQISKEDVSPTSSTGSRDSQSNTLLQNVFKGQNNLAQMMEMQKGQMPNMPQSMPNMPHMMDLQNLQNLQKSVPLSPFIDPMYMSAIYNSIAGQMDHRQLAVYRDLMASQFRYSGLLGATPTTKN